MKWYPLDKIVDELENRKWTWMQKFDLKYITIRVDTRDNNCLVFDRHDKLIAETWDDFKKVMDDLNETTEQKKLTTYQWLKQKIKDLDKD